MAQADIAAFTFLIRAHQGKLRAFLLRMTRGDHALADDLAQEAFLEAWRGIARFRGDGSFGSWLTSIAYRRYLAVAQSRRLESLDDEDVQAIETESGHHARLDLEKAMAKLSVSERAALTACYSLGLSHEEASRALAMPLGTLKSHVLRGREKLQKLLTGWEPAP